MLYNDLMFRFENKVVQSLKESLAVIRNNGDITDSVYRMPVQKMIISFWSPVGYNKEIAEESGYMSGLEYVNTRMLESTIFSKKSLISIINDNILKELELDDILEAREDTIKYRDVWTYHNFANEDMIKFLCNLESIEIWLVKKVK